MAYIGEKNNLSFRSGICEPSEMQPFTAEDAVFLGKLTGIKYKRICAGCCGFMNNALLYPLSGGCAEENSDVYMCEDTDILSLRFSVPLLSADCGIFIGSDRRIFFFDKNGAVISDNALESLKNTDISAVENKNGRIYRISSFRPIYRSNIETASGLNGKIECGISCGNTSVRSMWLDFFSGKSDDISLLISDDGSGVSAYSRHYGLISYEKLVMAYISMHITNGDTIFLPDTFHYSADKITQSRIIRFNSTEGIPQTAAKQRFLNDALYMCVMLLKDKELFYDTVKNLPETASVKRELAVSGEASCAGFHDVTGGRIIISKAGRSILSLTAQAANMEAASEICSEWTERLRINFGVSG